MRLAIFSLGLLSLVCSVPVIAQTAHYLDCSAGNDDASSLSRETAWRTIAKANSYVYKPGDSLLLRRGSRCEGMLSPNGSGTEQASIHISAYGRGALPVILGDTQPAGLQLYNQQYWEIENLEVIGGSPYGIHISGTDPVLHHFRITNVVVHDVTGIPLTKDSGLVVIAPEEKTATLIDDVIVDGVTAYSTTEWAGIIVNGGSFDATDNSKRGEHIEVRNSIVHDVAGDGILLARVTHGVLEHNVAWNTGMQETESIGTPNAIWEWRCIDCSVEYNEGFFTDSPGVDGGVFDIDFGDQNNRVEYNFGHDSQGYCVSIFGAEGQSGNSIQSVIRNNTCIHNGRSPRLAKRQGAIFLYTWKGGKLNGVEIQDNTIIWDPPLNASALQAAAEFTGDLPNRFTGNTILATSTSFTASMPALKSFGNRYCASSRAEPPLVWEGKSYPGPPTSTTTHVESDEPANHLEDLCGCMQNLLARTTGSVSEKQDALTMDGRWILLGDLDPEGGPASDESRSELVLIESMTHQFRNAGLGSIVLPTHAMNQDETEQWHTDWHFDPAIHIEATVAERLRKKYNLSPRQLVLVSPSGQIAANWQYPIEPADVWLQIASHLGTPAGTQQLPSCKRVSAQ